MEDPQLQTHQKQRMQIHIKKGLSPILILLQFVAACGSIKRGGSGGGLLAGCLLTKKSRL
jgi:hypothetical protein